MLKRREIISQSPRYVNLKDGFVEKISQSKGAYEYTAVPPML